MFVQRDLVDDCRVRIISDVSDDVREGFRYSGRKIYIIQKYLVNVHECLFGEIMQVYSLIVDVVHFLENRLCVAGLNEGEKIFDQCL